MQIFTGVSTKGLHEAVASALLAGTALGASAIIASPAMGQDARSYDIPAGPLASVLSRFIEASGVAVVYDAPLAQNASSAGLKGSYGEAEALSRILAGSGLTYRQTGPRSFTLERAPTAEAGTIQLGPVRVESDSQSSGGRYADMGETAWAPIDGYVALRSAAGTKTDTPIIETPQSISVVTRDELDVRAATTIREALGYSPGVQVDQGVDLRSEWFSIRGFDGTRSIYRDGLRAASVPRGFANGDLEPYALERVEVLRGPSSVMYGQAAPGGVVNLVTKRPTDSPLGEVELTAGRFNNKQIAFDLSGPTDAGGQLSYRLTGLLRDSDFQTDFVRNDRVYIAPALTWRPSDDTSLTLLANYQRDSKGSTANYDLPRVGTLSPNINGQIPIRRMNSEPGFDRYTKPQWSIGYLFDQRFDDTWSFRQNLRYSHIGTDYAGIYSYALAADERTVTRGAYTEVDSAYVLTLDNQILARFTHGRISHDLLLGLDYRSGRSTIKAGDGPAPSIDVFAPIYGASVEAPPLYEDSLTRTSQLGLYAQDQIKFDDKLVLMAGIRWDRAKSHRTDAIAQSNDNESDSKFTGRAGLVYLFDNGLAPYLSYSTSFEPASGVSFDGARFKPTTGQQAEIGLRYQPEGSRSMVTVSLFDLKQKNVLTTDPDPSHVNFSIQTGEVRSRGLEFEGKLAIDRSINLTASYSYLDAKITASNDGVEGNRRGGIPRHSAALWADYAFRSGTLNGLSLGAGARYVGSTPIADTNIYRMPARVLVDALLRYDWDQLTLSINASNLFDKRFVSKCYNDDYGACTYGTVRNVMASLRYHW